MSLIKKIHKNKKGLTFIEIIVTVAIMAIASSIFAVTYANVMEDKRMEADMSRLNNLDVSLEQILIYQDAFEEAKTLVVDDNKLNFTFPVSYDKSTNSATIKLEDTLLNGDGKYLKDVAPYTYAHLEEFIGDDEIKLDSGSYKNGKYCVYIEFDGIKISSVREYSISNDTMIITNSGDEYLYTYDK